MSLDTQDPSPSPEPGTELDSSIMPEARLDRTSSEEKSPSQQGQAQHPQQQQQLAEAKPKTNAKDPSRPRRKKARRACFACQRAHLTCGDERPCLRCIKRGLQDQCCDGVRKKAKYLHDAPAEALNPGFQGHYHHNTNGTTSVTTTTTTNNTNNSNTNGLSGSTSTNGFAIPQTTTFINAASTTNFPPFNQASQISPSLIEGNDPMLTSSVDGTTYHSISNHGLSPQPVPSAPGNVLSSASHHGPFDTSYIDPSDPTLFNFNISELNFGNHYGALEFGMLNHMSAGAVGTPDVESITQLGGSSHHQSLSYDSSNSFSPATNFNFNTQGFSTNNNNNNWQGVPTAASRHGSVSNAWTVGNGLDAFAIGELSGHSPHSQNHDHNGLPSPETSYGQPDQELLRQSFSQAQRKAPPGLLDQTAQRKRRRDASDIYTSVTAPYPYTQGFHALTAFLQKRYPSHKTLKIAKALASIRPSFISCNKSLNHDDLIFGEKCFQRTLWEYEDFISHYGIPTLICRRTGEVAGVSKEFSLVTGWRRDVLLGKETNLNVNTTSNTTTPGTQTGTSSRGAITPRLPPIEMDTGRPQAVFLAELMDEDSVVQFYEDFAELAFGASRAAIVGQEVMLLKYKTKQDVGWRDVDQITEDGLPAKREEKPARSDGIISLGDKEGRIPCRICWTVKRDVFDIPMLIVINFLPVI